MASVSQNKSRETRFNHTVKLIREGPPRKKNETDKKSDNVIHRSTKPSGSSVWRPDVAIHRLWLISAGRTNEKRRQVDARDVAFVSTHIRKRLAEPSEWKKKQQNKSNSPRWSLPSVNSVKRIENSVASNVWLIFLSEVKVAEFCLLHHIQYFLA